MGERLIVLGQNRTEKLFYLSVVDVCSSIQYNPSIRSPYPVADRYGVVRKVVTTPDFLLTFPDGAQMYVEITKGSGDLPAKAAQQRVVDAAGITNYVQLTGDQVSLLSATPTPFEKTQLLYGYFGWIESFPTVLGLIS